MTIISAGPVQPPVEPSLPTRRATASESRFIMPEVPVLELPASLGSVAPSGSSAVMLALQEAAGGNHDGSNAAQDREARQHGRDILAALAELQKGLLTDAVSAGILARLASVAALPLAASDPGLATILSSIRLRARLEILRIEGVARRS